MFYARRFATPWGRAKSTFYASPHTGEAWYDSAFEAEYAKTLDLRLRGSKYDPSTIRSWERQVITDCRMHDVSITKYKWDFVLTYPDGTREYIECKGYAGDPYWKIRFKMATAQVQHDDPCAKVTLVLQDDSQWKRMMAKKKPKSKK